MNMMSSLFDSINPCIGCTSTACKSCGCREDMFNLLEYKTPRPRETRERKRTPCVQVKPVIPAGIAVSCGFSDFPAKRIVNLPVEIFGRHESQIIMHADGDGMRNAGIATGDCLLFTSDFNPVDGDIVLATVDGVKLCRRIFRENEQEYRIRREDGETPDVITKDCIVHGVLVSVTHRRSSIAS